MISGGCVIFGLLDSSFLSIPSFIIARTQVTDANFDCSGAGISLQAMDSSHVSLVSLLLRSDGFEPYRCDHTINLGINIASMAKVRTLPEIIFRVSDSASNLVGLLFHTFFVQHR